MTKKKTLIFDQDKMTEILNQEALREVEFTKKVCDKIQCNRCKEKLKLIFQIGSGDKKELLCSQCLYQLQKKLTK